MVGGGRGVFPPLQFCPYRFEIGECDMFLEFSRPDHQKQLDLKLQWLGCKGSIFKKFKKNVRKMFKIKYFDYPSGTTDKKMFQIFLN